MLNKTKNKIREMILSRNTNIVLTLIVILNIIVFPSCSFFPFQWTILLGAILVNIFVKKAIIRSITMIIILLSSVSMLFMDIIGCLFFSQNVLYCILLYVFAIVSILNVLVSVKLLIDDLASISQK